MFMHIYEIVFYNIKAPKEHCMWLLVAFEVDFLSHSLTPSYVCVKPYQNEFHLNSSVVFLLEHEQPLSVYIIWIFIPALLLEKVKSFLKSREPSIGCRHSGHHYRINFARQ